MVSPEVAAVVGSAGQDTRLLVVALLGIVLIVVLITWAKLHPFLALLVGSAVVGFASGVAPGAVVTNFESGVGDTLKEVGLLIALGAMLGRLLADSGGADQVIDTLVARASPRMLPWAMALVAMIIGLPMFFEIGLVLLLPVIVLVARHARLPLMRIGIPALAGLSVLHGLIPPHPGPLIAIDAVHAPLGLTLALGLLVAVPTVVVCGPLLSLPAARWVPVGAPAPAGGDRAPDRAREDRGEVGREDGREIGAGVGPRDGREIGTGAGAAGADRPGRRPSFAVTVATILLPVVLMLARAVADIAWPDARQAPPARALLDFVGEPLVALTVAVLVALVTFGFSLAAPAAELSRRVGAAVAPVATVILVVGAGGGFKQTLVGAGVGHAVATLATGAHLSVLLLGWLIAVALRLATGSATVATVTAAGIVAPLAGSLSPTHTALLALAIGCGSLFLSHVNDAGFWLVKELFGLSVGQTFATWSTMETAISVVGLGLVGLLSTVL